MCAAASCVSHVPIYVPVTTLLCKETGDFMEQPDYLNLAKEGQSLEDRKRDRKQWVGWGLGAALLLFVLGQCVNPCTANDLFWQLRVGQEIRLTHHLPHADVYSWTRPGQTCVMHEWLAFVLFSKVYDMAGGFAGVWLLQAALVVLTFALLYKFILRETEYAPFSAFLITMAAGLASSPFFQPRPHLFTYLFLTLEMGLLVSARRQPELRKLLWLLVPLTAVWANLHAGALLGLIVQVLFVIGQYAGVYLRRDDETAISANPGIFNIRNHALHHSSLIAFACALATLFNPYGAQIYHNLFATLSNGTAMNAVTEWFSPDFHEASGKLFELLAALVLTGFACTRLRRDAGSLLVTLLLLHAALTAFRNVPLFALAGVLLAAPHIQSALMRLLPDPQHRETSLFGKAPDARLVPVLLALFALLTWARLERGAMPGSAVGNRPIPSKSFGRLEGAVAGRSADEASAGRLVSPYPGRLETLARNSFQWDAFPERACRFLEAAHLPADTRLFNDYNYGGYLIWRLPQYRVFVDGRADIYFGAVLDDCVKIHVMKPDWKQILARYNPDVALVAASSPEAHLLRSAPEWKLLYAEPGALENEQGALVFIRSKAPVHAQIAQSR